MQPDEELSEHDRYLKNRLVITENNKGEFDVDKLFKRYRDAKVRDASQEKTN